MQPIQARALAGVPAFHDFTFTDRLRESGITFRNRSVDDAGRTYKAAHYDHGNGLAVADVDGDGLVDVYFVSQVGGNQLWRNIGGGRFEDITASAGVAVPGRISVTASFADIDNDGDADLYVTTVRGGNVLFENQGNGRFRDISAESGLNYTGHSSGAVFFDYDRDGRLDLLLLNVGKYTTETLAGDAPYRYYLAFDDAFHGHLMPERAERSLLFHNEGNNRLTDVTDQMGLTGSFWSGDASVVDVNDDGWPDLYVLNMQGNDQVLRERPRPEVRQSEPRAVPAHVVGIDGHQGVRLQQRRPAGHPRHRHAFGHEPRSGLRPGEEEVRHAVAHDVPRRWQHEHLGQLVVREGWRRHVS